MRTFLGVQSRSAQLGKGSDGKMSLPAFPKFPQFSAARVFHQLDDLRLDSLPVFKASPSVFSSTSSNPRSCDPGRQKNM